MDAVTDPTKKEQQLAEELTKDRVRGHWDDMGTPVEEE